MGPYLKTSLNIEESLLKEAKKYAEKHGRTLGETITYWARLGCESLKAKHRQNAKAKPIPLDLGGGAKVDLTSRRDWLDELE